MRLRSTVAIALTALGLAVPGSPSGHVSAAGPTWAPAATATVQPGVRLFTNGA